MVNIFSRRTCAILSLPALLLQVHCGAAPAPAVVEDGQIATDVSDATVTPDATVEVAVDTGPDIPVIPEKTGCHTGEGKFKAGLTTLQWDDDQPLASVAEQEKWTMVGKKVNEADMWEAVRFDLAHPAKIHGFSIRWNGAPTEADAELAAGLFPDFSHNGFDFWRFAATKAVARCASDWQDGEWLDYVFDTPVEIDQPGLVYVAHERKGKDEPAWLFDGTPPKDCADPNNCCAPFTACHSAWNFPKIVNYTAGGQQNFAWNGLSTSLQYDYMVRLQVEYTQQLEPKDKFFQPVVGVNTSSRQAFADYDNDGDDDMLVSGPTLYQNDGKGNFTDVSKDAGLTGEPGSGGVWGDYDNDGCLDLFLFSEGYGGGDALMHSDCKGKFVDVTLASGITDTQDYNPCMDKATNTPKATHTPTAGAAWLDIDGDGKLDLYLANFICWDDYTYYLDDVWHQKGDGTFEYWTGKNGFLGKGSASTPSRGASPIDYDQDGDIDLLVNNYVLIRNLFYRNDGGGKVTEIGATTGFGGTATKALGQTYYGHSIGTAWGDLNNDGIFDVVVANLAHPRFWSFSNKTQVLIGDGKGNAKDIQGDWSFPAGAAGLRYIETHSIPVLADFNQDGNEDLSISCVYDGRPTDFYWGKGDGTFTLDVYHAGITVTGGWGMATSDIDNDGDVDLAATGILYRNELPAEKKGHFLQVRVIGDGKTNRAGLGATVRVTAGGKTYVRHVNGGTGQGDQDSLTLHFGLGKVDSIDSIDVRFIGGGVVNFKGPIAVDQRVWLYESGKITKGWKP